jgi:hypothetical protein
MRSAFIVLALGLAMATGQRSEGERAQHVSKESPVQLLPGYRYTNPKGIDSAVGRIWKDGGPDISYGFGFFAGDQAREYAAKNPKVSLTEIGSSATGQVVVALDEDHDAMVVSIDNRCQFSARNVRTRKDVMEVLLIANFLARLPPK